MTKRFLALTMGLTACFVRISALYFFYPEVVNQLLKQGAFVNQAHVIALILYAAILSGGSSTLTTMRLAAHDKEFREFVQDNYFAILLAGNLISGAMLWLMTAMF